jgi:elongation factor G
MAIEPRSSADRDKLAEALESLAAEDPTCQIKADPETGQTIISGMGELHLEILVDRLRREFGVGANTGQPMVAYFETITRSGRAENLFDREFGGRRQYAGVVLEVDPRERGGGNVIEFSVDAKAVPEAFHEAIGEGIRDGLAAGVLARYPVADVRVRVVGGAFDRDDSTETAFRTASILGLRGAMAEAAPELLEPMMSVEIVTPAEFMGDVIGDLNGRRGKITEMTARGTTQIVAARVPLAEMFGYSTAIRSLSKGRATYTMEPEQFDLVPKGIRDRLLSR